MAKDRKKGKFIQINRLPVVWRHVADPRANELIGRAISMILGDTQAGVPDPSVDGEIGLKLNEEAPVEGIQTKNIHNGTG